jgi:hypothetical protein
MCALWCILLLDFEERKLRRGETGRKGKNGGEKEKRNKGNKKNGKAGERKIDLSLRNSEPGQHKLQVASDVKSLGHTYFA